MPWPTPQDYFEAIQNPRLCFSDSELMVGDSDRDPHLNLPRPITGGFASVYRMRCRQRDWAVRCFLREFSDQQQRYELVSSHLASVSLPYIVGFEYQPKGIKVKGQWYPIQKMEWIQGALLHDYIKSSLRDSARLFRLAERWLAMIKGLREANICHGDLQHGNILVIKDDFQLIDYDGMFVPALASRLSHEVGHRNYQHPQRTESDFGPYIDNFAAWVIYFSLVALGIDYQLWHQTGAGDEFILFRKEDFVEPDSSSTFAILTKHADSRIQLLTAFFQSLLYLSPQQIPSLDGQLTLQVISTTQTSSKNISWLSDHIQIGQVQNGALASPNSEIANSFSSPSDGSAWVLDHISMPTTNGVKSFASSMTIPRVTVLLSILSFLLVLASWGITLATPITFLFYLSPTIFLINTLVLLHYYRQDSVVAEQKVLITSEVQANGILNSIQNDIKDWHGKKKTILMKGNKKRAELIKLQSDLQNKEKSEKSRTDARIRQNIHSINSRRLALQHEEANALKKVRGAIGDEISKQNTQLAQLSQSESNEITQVLVLKQKQFLKDYLGQYRIQDASISGIGEKLKARLVAAGIHTAADITHNRITSVEGIGTNKGSALISWRASIEQKGSTRIPNSLTPTELNSIKQKYEHKRNTIESQINKNKQALNAQESAIRDEYAKKKKYLDSEQLTTQNKLTQELLIITNKYSQDYADISQKLSQLDIDMQAQIRKHDDVISNLHKRVFDCHWQLGKIRHELRTYGNISFGKYIRFVCVGR
jgi:hypothetical protein